MHSRKKNCEPMGDKTQKSINVKAKQTLFSFSQKQSYERTSLNYTKSSEQPQNKPALLPLHRPRTASSVLLAIDFSLLPDTYSGFWQTVQ